MTKPATTRVVLVAASLMSVSAVPHAQEWPTKLIRMIIPNPPGGIADSVGRLSAAWLADKLGQPVVVENRAGASGAIASEYVAKAPPDGYTLYFATMAQMAIVPAMRKTNYDPIRDFAPIARIGSAVHVLGVNDTVPAKTLGELVQMAKQRPGVLAYAAAGSGSATHLAMVKLINAAGIDMLQVNYVGGGPAQAGLLGGQVAAYFGNMAELLPLVRAGKIRALAVGSDQRKSTLPDVPTVAESGYPGFTAELWVSVVAPAATPGWIIERVAAQTAAGSRDPGFIARLEALGVDPTPAHTPADFARFIAAEVASWAKVVKAANIKSE